MTIQDRRQEGKPVPTTPTEDQARSHLLQLEVALNQDLIERSQAIKGVINALVSRTHLFQLGSPGIAKSALVDRTVRRISGVRYFRWLLTKYTTPEELFGPPSLKSIENDEYVRILTGKMAEAELALTDECFKANSAVLNSMLTILNERIFDNGSAAVQVPLSTMFCASNEMPQGDELAALFDRLHFRFYMKPLQSRSSFMRMLQLRWDPNPDTVVSWDEILVAQEAAAQVTVPTDVFEAMAELRDLLKKEGVTPTERRFMESERIIQAAAWLHGRNQAEVDDMQILSNVFWDRHEDIAAVSRCVMSLANPLDKAAQDLLEEIEDINRDMERTIANADSQQTLARQSVEFFNKLTKSRTEITDLSAQFHAAGRKSEYLDDLRTRYSEVAAVCQQKCFNVTTSDKLAIRPEEAT